MKRKALVVIAIFLFVIAPLSALACKPLYTPGEDVIISDVIEPSGIGATCNLSLYKGLTFNQSGVMNVSGLAYNYNASNLDIGTYSASIVCLQGTDTYLGECKFKVGEDSTMLLAVMVLVPMLLGFFFLFFAKSLGEAHSILRIFLSLLSIPSFFVSLHFGLLSIVKLYDFPELQNAIGSTTYWVGLVFAAIIAYFFIYSIYVMVKSAAQAKQEKLEY